MAETEMDSDRYVWAFDSETHISTSRERPEPMAAASRCIRSKPHAPNKSGCHETKDPLQLGVYERHARRDYSICAACTEEPLHIRCVKTHALSFVKAMIGQWCEKLCLS